MARRERVRVALYAPPVACYGALGALRPLCGLLQCFPRIRLLSARRGVRLVQGSLGHMMVFPEGGLRAGPLRGQGGASPHLYPLDILR